MKIFTSYYKDHRLNIDDIYTNTLIKNWVNYHQKFNAELYIVTNSENLKSRFNTLELDFELKTEVNPMTHQISAWKTIGNFINEESSIYLDPDAYLLDDRLIEYANKQTDYKVTKKKNPYGFSDIGVSIIKNTLDFRKFISECEGISTNKFIRCHMEHVLDTSNRKKFISWSECPILLASSLCGFSENICCVHGFPTNYDNNLKKIINKIPKEIMETLAEKRKIESIYKYP